MPNLRQPVPAEEKQSNEASLQKERHQAFDRERHAKNVANVVGVIGPVHPELEFHGNTRGDAHREVDAEQQPPVLSHLPPDDASRHDIDALHDRQQD